MKKTMIVASFLALAPFAKGQLLLEALEGGVPFTPSEKCLERVYDKHYGDGVHNYIYCAVQGPNGKKWLNLNLGAEYAKESSPHFNPEALPTDYNDWKAFGNLYQWGRDSDGHEQVEYRQGSENWEFRPINGVRNKMLVAGEQSNQMVQDSNANVYAENLGESWTNNPCPNGYHIATMEDIKGLGRLNKIYGTHTSSSLFGTTLYPNLILMTSPGTSPFNPVNAGWNVSSAGETSSMWLDWRASNQIYTYSDTWQNEYDGYNSKNYMCELDRGYWPRPWPTDDVHNYGVSCDHTRPYNYDIVNWENQLKSTPAKAIRCVQN